MINGKVSVTTTVKPSTGDTETRTLTTKISTDGDFPVAAREALRALGWNIEAWTHEVGRYVHDPGTTESTASVEVEGGFAGWTNEKKTVIYETDSKVWDAAEQSANSAIISLNRWLNNDGQGPVTAELPREDSNL
jgi:hypothetical protein